jgi:small-conductance mechanosensitive channel
MPAPVNIFAAAFQDALAELQQMLASAIAYLPRLLAGIVVAVAAWLLARWLRGWAGRIARRARVPDAVSGLIANAAYVVALLLGVTVTLAALGVQVYALVTGLGIGGLVIGFALKDIIENLIAGVLLLVQRPFDPGDLVSVGGVTGHVTGVHLRATTLKTLDNEEVVIPNADVYTGQITNYSTYLRRRRRVSLAIDFTEDLARVAQIVLDAVRAVEGVAADPAPSIALDDFGDNAISGTLYYYIDTSAHDYVGTHNAVVRAVQEAVNRTAVQLPIPTSVVITRSE